MSHQEILFPEKRSLFSNTQNMFIIALGRESTIFSSWFLVCSWPHSCEDNPGPATKLCVGWHLAGTAGNMPGRVYPSAWEAGMLLQPRRRVVFPSLPFPASTPSHAQCFRRLCTGTRIWALINRIISYEFLLPFSVGCFTRAVGLPSLR